MRLAIVISHPIQYYAPVFKLMAQQKVLEIKVFYSMGEMKSGSYDHGFKKNITWDVPVMEGYDYEWATNIAATPGTHHRGGIVTPGLIGQVKAWNPDALMVYGWSYHSHLVVLRYFKNIIPVFFRGDSTLLDVKNGLLFFLRTIFLKWVYRHIDHAFYVGTNNREYFKRFGLRNEQLTFSPHAVDNERFFADRTVNASAVRKKLDIAEDQILILFAGKFQLKKSPFFLLDNILTLENPHVHLLFVGDGNLDVEMKAKATGAGNIHFLPFQNQSKMPEIYQACDIFCLPSAGPGETWGLAINEAMASGKAILASDKVGCAVDLVKPGYTGEIFKAGDKADFKLKLGYLINDKNLLRKLGSNAKNEITNWNFDLQVTNMIDVIKTYEPKY